MIFKNLATFIAAAFALIEYVNADNATTSSTASYDPRTYSTYEPSATDIAQLASNSTSLQWTTNVEGKAFNRFMVIWLENTDYDKAADNDDLNWLAEQGITLTNYWALTHPSEPNYMASVGGDYFSLNDDRFISLPKNVSTIADLLDEGGISWAEYQEDIPFSGFQGFNYSNQVTFANDYVRKHNPLMLYESVTSNSTRLSLIKNQTEFTKDLEEQKLPQYMIWTPNMLNDGHDTTIKYAGNWTRTFLEPLLENEYFMNDTLILLTFDENENYGMQNTVFSVLLGGVIPDELKGTNDDTFYDHYSQIATVEANWDLYCLGRNDVDANIFSLVAEAAGISNKEVDTTYKLNNDTYVGYLLDDQLDLPAPNVSAVNMNGKGVLPTIVDTWKSTFEEQVSASYFTPTTTTVSIGGVTNAVTLATVSFKQANSSAYINSTTATNTRGANATASSSQYVSATSGANESSTIGSASKSANGGNVINTSLSALLLGLVNALFF
ncbi:related to Probable acid phosphatase [Saccharomycodes ludwigii]|uniref:acid phosphatase n=1 Tax=Saccharomycodes ludwigii TaxID=36035 RepID=A0A376B998_9ASCO|nr:conserved putative acid phosphatase [Saccharomycodes ludwigii]KAH3901550.1 conserved putative acid phosphatase [Saccharomycodes ludwigii]SSD61245.1 related to Probable acid phosphatase [Saccharomycodes ludwigii]